VMAKVNPYPWQSDTSIGDWQKAAKKQGLKFGVSEHLGASFTWFQSSHRADKEGPKAGVPYDGADPKWQDLYHFPAEPGDTGWYSKNPKWHQQWYDRIKELVDNYHPDLLYTDGGVPFGNEVGRSLIAHLYNSDLRNRGRSGQDFIASKGAELLTGSGLNSGGHPEVVYTCKQKSEGRWVEDLERGVMAKVNPYPWQSDTSIGDWFYNRNWKFRPVSWSIHMLVDIVSKNGNLLLNVVQRPDGSLDPEVEQALAQMADWIAIHGEAIYGTRPWLVYGEGVVKAKGGSFGEDFKYTATDIRFTTKGKTLYALALGWPNSGRLVIKSLAKPADGKGNQIQRVELLGFKGKLAFSQTASGLEVILPDKKVSEFTAGLKITGTDLKPVQLSEAVAPVRPDAQGVLMLNADSAELHGDQIKQENQGGQPNIGFWDRGEEWISWRVQFAKPGTYTVSAICATTHPESHFVVEAAGQQIFGKVAQTGAWDAFRSSGVGQIVVAQAGEQIVKVRPKDPANWKAVNLRSLKFSRAE
jgi:alpha-L-fucosidase